MLKYVDHVHYAVQDCDAMVQYIEKMFAMTPDDRSVYDYRGLTMMKEAIYNLGTTQMQVTEPVDWRNNPRSRMGKRVAAQGPCVTHVGWGVDDIGEAARELTAKGTKTRGNEDMLHPGLKGYITINVDPEYSHGLQVQIVAGKHESRAKQPMFKYVDHVHYAVRECSAMMEFIERTFNMKPVRVFENSGNEQSAEYDIGETKIQITSAADPASPIGKFVANNGPGVFNLGWGVDDVGKAVQDLAAKGTRVQQRDKEQNAGFTRGRQVCDTDPSDSLGLVFRLVGG